MLLIKYYAMTIYCFSFVLQFYFTSSIFAKYYDSPNLDDTPYHIENILRVFFIVERFKLRYELFLSAYLYQIPSINMMMDEKKRVVSAKACEREIA